jgi:twinkle protein
MYENGLQRGLSTGWVRVDELFSVKPGELTLVTGIPSHGKSEWLDALAMNLAIEHGWVFGVCSPENMPLPRHLSKLLEKHSGKPFRKEANGRMSYADLASSLQWLDQHFHFIVPDEAITIEKLLEKSIQLVNRHGIRGLIIDPWNEFDHRRPANVNETEYVSQSLGIIRRFGRNRGVHVFIVAHPTKLQKEKDGSYPVPTPYDVSGSAHWRNKPDNCIAIHRPTGGRETEIHFQKIRWRDVGQPGLATLLWNPVNGRYDDIGKLIS